MSGDLDFFSDALGKVVHVTVRAEAGDDLLVKVELLCDLDMIDAKRAHEELGEAIRRNEHNAAALGEKGQRTAG